MTAILVAIVSLGGGYFLAKLQDKYDRRNRQYEERKKAYLGVLKFIRMADIERGDINEQKIIFKEFGSVRDEVSLFGSKEVNDKMNQSVKAVVIDKKDRHQALNELTELMQKDIKEIE